MITFSASQALRKCHHLGLVIMALSVCMHLIKLIVCMYGKSLFSLFCLNVEFSKVASTQRVHVSESMSGP